MRETMLNFMKCLGACALVCPSLVVAASEPADANARAVGPYGLDPDAYIIRYKDVFPPVVGRGGMVSTQNDLATEVGVDILRRGGNAVDAAVAVGFALAVTLPRAGNLGGGGFMLVHHNGETSGIDYRETAPSGVSAGDFLDENNEKDLNARFKWPAVGVPGTVAGLHAAWESFGTLPWKMLLQPAIDLAGRGFAVSYDLAEILAIKKPWLSQDPAALRAFYPAAGGSYAPGQTMARPALAETLRILQANGPKPFYEGSIADQIVTASNDSGGYITAADLAAYRPIFRPVLKGTYRGYGIAAMPPPSSGGVAIIEMLNILENFPIADWGYSARSLHVLAEAMKIAFADRGFHLADPAFADVPVARLTDKAYAAQRAKQIKPGSVLKLGGGADTDNESSSTTHYSIVDANGNAVSNTYTLSSSFGAGLVVPNTGILLNNQIHTFSVRAGIPGAVGFIASEANKIEPGKRPVSSQSPTIVLRDGRPYIVVGSPGGSRIISTVVQIIVNVIDHKMNIASATNERRIHHQWVPDQLELEPGFSSDTADLLRAWGHNITTAHTMGSSQSIFVGPNHLFGASDPRRPNALTLGVQ